MGGGDYTQDFTVLYMFQWVNDFILWQEHTGECGRETVVKVGLLFRFNSMFVQCSFEKSQSLGC